MAKNDTNSYRATIPATEITSQGLEYFLKATNVDFVQTRLPASSVFSIPIRVNNGINIALLKGIDQTAYRLISVPLNLDDQSPRVVLEDDLGSYNRKGFRFFELRADQRYAEFHNADEPTAVGRNQTGLISSIRFIRIQKIVSGLS